MKALLRIARRVVVYGAMGLVTAIAVAWFGATGNPGARSGAEFVLRWARVVPSTGEVIHFRSDATRLCVVRRWGDHPSPRFVEMGWALQPTGGIEEGSPAPGGPMGVPHRAERWGVVGDELAREWARIEAAGVEPEPWVQRPLSDEWKWMSGVEYASGWPRLALRGGLYWNDATGEVDRRHQGSAERWAWARRWEQKLPERLRASVSDGYPLTPIWSGLLFNAAFFGVAWWAPVALFGVARTHRRYRHGRCPRCGYALRRDYSGGCSECGWGTRGLERA